MVVEEERCERLPFLLVVAYQETGAGEREQATTRTHGDRQCLSESPPAKMTAGKKTPQVAAVAMSSRVVED